MPLLQPRQPGSVRFPGLALEMRLSSGYTEHMSSEPANPVNYDSPAILEVAIEGTDYRMDSGKQGTALCISTRPSGTWDWSFGGEARWDVSYLRSKAFDRRTLEQLSRAFAEALQNME